MGTKMTDDDNQILQEAEPSSSRLILTLSLAGFLSGVVLVAAYLFANPIIEKNKSEALQRAIFKVLPGTQSTKTLALKNGMLVETIESSDESEKIYLGLDSLGEMVGFAIPGAEPGFQDVIGALFGYKSAEREIIGLEILECKETPGLGDKIFKDRDFSECFKSLYVEPEIEFVKKGSATKKNEVDGITGATISSKAVVRLLNNSIVQWKVPIDTYLKGVEDRNKSEQ